MSPSARNSPSHLPTAIDPIQLAEKGARLTGTLPLKAMTRLTSSCLEDTGTVHVDLTFGRVEGGDVLEMSGTVRAAVRVACQRCLEPMGLELKSDTRLLLLRPGEREHLLTQEADALAVDHPLSLSELAEDELLLVLPMIPMHPPGACPVGARLSPAEKQGQTAGRNPFSALDRLKRTKR